MSVETCRLCGTVLEHTFVNLGLSPLANSYVPLDKSGSGEHFYPLHPKVCPECKLVQVPELETREAIFGDYAYFSSFSDGWLEHCRRYVDAMRHRFVLGSDSLVAEVASNDGYLLQYFVKAGVPVLGVEPAANVAKVAQDSGVRTHVAFFGVDEAKALRETHGTADLMIANNVLAHVPDIKDFIGGFAEMLAPQGVLTVEFPHLLRLIEECQFDTIYHEHFSYLSLAVVQRAFAEQGLRVFDVEQIPTHGGSLRVYAGLEDRNGATLDSVKEVLELEKHAGLGELAAYEGFGRRVIARKMEVLDFLISARREGKTVLGYGAPAKGNTLLNYCGVGPELMPFTVDRSEHKQGNFLPGCRIPIKSPDDLIEARPDYVFILPWNIKKEIMEQLAVIREWGGQFVTAIPRLEVS